MRIIVLGSQGNLGRQLVDFGRRSGNRVTLVDREDVDLTDSAAAYRTVRDGHFDAVFNAVAWNDVDGAEDPANRQAVWRLNAELPGVLAAAAAETGAAFVHYSSDYVFAGDRPSGYEEGDRPDPISEYGRSKWAGEQAVASVGRNSFVCRTSKLFGPAGDSPVSKPGFVDMMLRLSSSRPELSLVDEEVGCPTYTADLAEASYRLLDGGFDPGTYHLVNSGPGVTWYAFAEEFFQLAGIDVRRRPVSSAEFPKPAARPKMAFLKNTKFPPMRPRVEALRHYLNAVDAVRVKLAN
jgi:dTDP-4-dehydrorhamnose reductase